MNIHTIARRLSVPGLLLLAPPVFAQAIEVPLKYHADTSEFEDLYISGNGDVEVLEACPDGDWTLPECLAPEPKFGFVTLGDSKFLIALDRAKKSDEFYTRVHLDANANGDLTDDESLVGTIMTFGESDGFYYAYYEGTIDLEFEADGRMHPYRLGFTVQGQDPEKLEMPEGMEDAMFSYLHVNIEAPCFYAGEFTRGDDTYRFAISDENCNGFFGDQLHIDDNVRFPARYPIWAQGDRIYLTADEDLSYQDTFTLGARLMLGKELFDVEVDAAGGKLVLTPTAGELVPLRFQMLPDRMLLDSRTAGQAVMLYRPDEVAMLPPGDYRPLSYQLRATGTQNDVWFLAAGATRRTPYVTLAAGPETILEFGAPFTALAEVDDHSRKALANGDLDEVRVSFNVEGAAHELLTDLSRLEGTNAGIVMSSEDKDKPREPAYMVYTKDGKLVQTDSFEYG